MIMRLMLVLILLLTVTGVWAQDAPADFYIEASVDNPTPFAGQQIIYLVRVYSAVDGVQVSPLYEPPDIEGLWRVDVLPVPYSQTPQQVNGRAYVVSEIRAALFPPRASDFTIAPASIILPETVFQQEQRVESNAVTVQAQPLPDGAPSGFNGAVGQFELAATLDRQSVRLGEPVTLRLTVRGTGNVEQLPPPDVPLPEGWQAFANPSTYTALQDSGRIVGEKVFEWVLVPGQPGTHTLPVISLAYFDPAALAYRSLDTAPTVIEVLPGAAGTGAAERGLSGESRMPIKPVPAVLHQETADPGWFFWLLWGVPPLAAAGASGWLVRRNHRRRNRPAARRSAALARAEARIQAVSNAAPKQTYRFLNEIAAAYLGDKLNVQLNRVSQEDARRLMEERHIAPEIIRRVLICLERANEGEYGPARSVDARQLARYTLETLKLLDAVWESQ